MERHPSCLWSRRINIVKMTILPKVYNSHKNSNTDFYRLEKDISQHHMEKQKAQKSQNNSQQLKNLE